MEEERQEDQRNGGAPPEKNEQPSERATQEDGGDEPLRAADPPEPLIVPPDELRQQYREEYERMVEDETTRVYVHVAEYFKVKSFRQVFKFMGLHMRTYNAARVRPGFVGGGIRGRWWAKSFWTYSIWESREAIERFSKRGTHMEAADRVHEYAAPGSCYVTWEGTGESDWSEALSRLEHPTRYFVDPYFG